MKNLLVAAFLALCANLVWMAAQPQVPAPVAAVAVQMSPISDAHAGTITINTDASTDTEIQAWCQAYAGLSSAPNAATIKNSCVIPLLKASIRAYKLTQSVNAITPYEPSQMN